MSYSRAEDGAVTSRRLHHVDGDTEFDVIYVDGMGLPKLQTLLIDDPINRLNNIRDLETKENDILLITYPKSGTHWVWEILNMLVQGNSTYRKENMVTTMLEAIPDLKLLDRENSPRILNTHMPFRWLPKKHLESGGKIIHVRRNPKDVSVSAFHHFLSSDGTGYGDKNMTWQQFFDNVVVGNVPLYDGWFKYEKDVEFAKGTKQGASIHSLLYERLLLDPVIEIKQLAQFLGVPISNELAEEIADQCSLEKLRTCNKQIPVDFFKMFKEMSEQTKTSPIKPPVIYRKGVVGDWKNHFTVAQNEVFDSIYIKEMENLDLDVIFESPERRGDQK